MNRKIDFLKITYNVSCFGIILTLLISGIAKFIEPTYTVETLKELGLFDENFALIIASILPFIEIASAIGILTKTKPKIVFTLVFSLFSVFLLVSIAGTILEIDADCGCFGTAISSKYGYEMIIRNLILLGIAYFTFHFNVLRKTV
ncbi:MAG: methylamine utilization protein [Ignavibacteria bacterium]|nr:methylamine utilization protein [Ignavibacteria bacterium]